MAAEGPSQFRVHVHISQLSGLSRARTPGTGGSWAFLCLAESPLRSRIGREVRFHPGLLKSVNGKARVTPEMLGSGGGEICESLTLCGQQTLLGYAMDIL